jgi:hypothetical protein
LTFLDLWVFVLIKFGQFRPLCFQILVLSHVFFPLLDTKIMHLLDFSKLIHSLLIASLLFIYFFLVSSEYFLLLCSQLHYFFLLPDNFIPNFFQPLYLYYFYFFVCMQSRGSSPGPCAVLHKYSTTELQCIFLLTFFFLWYWRLNSGPHTS